MANTYIQIKRSSATGKPASLKTGELAYSYASNTLFVGTADGLGSLNIGGQFYTSTIDSATSANTASTLVKRDANFGFFGALYGNANSATALLNAQNFSISGGDVTAATQSFNGTGAVVLNASLTNTGVAAGTYGGATQIPFIQVAANGRVVFAGNVSAAASSWNVVGNTGSISQSTGQNQNIYGATGSGLNTTVTGSGGSTTTVINTDSTILRSNTNLSTGWTQIVDSDMIVTGNLTIQNTFTTFNINSSTVQTGDSLIKLATNNLFGDTVDIGFYGASNTGAAVVYHGLIREGSGGTSAGNFYLFKNLPTDPTGNTVTYASLTRANLIANITGGTVSGLATQILVADGGTGAGSFTNGAILVGGGTGALAPLANTGTAGSYGSSSYIPVITTDAYGRVSGVANTQVSVPASAISSGTLGIARGGTNQTSFTNDTLVYYSSAAGALSSTANVTSAGSYANANTHLQMTVDAWGRVTSANSIAISGLLVNQGGTGAASFTNGAILVGGGTGALTPLTNTTSSGVYGSASYLPIITVDAYGRVSAVTNTQIAIAGSQITSGTVGIGQGGTNSSSFTTNQIVYYNGTSIVSLANTGTAGTTGSSSYVPVITTDGFGRISSIANTQIAIAASQITSGTVTVGQGGTGVTALTLNGVVFGNGTSPAGITAAAGGADQTWSNQILTVTNAGVPVWSTALDGGSF